MKFYKILNEEENHNGLQYKTGLNIDPLPFNPSGTCRSGGMYYAQKDILVFLYIGPWIREVTLCPNSNIYKDPGYGAEKWKTDKFILGERTRINSKIIEDLIQEGAYVDGNCSYSLAWCLRNGKLDMSKVIIENDKSNCYDITYILYNIKKENRIEFIKLLVKNKKLFLINYIMLFAAENNDKKLLSFSLNQGADINFMRDKAIYLAILNGNFEIMKFLIKNGAKNNDPKNLIIACSKGYLDIVKYLLEHGSNPHAQGDKAFKKSIYTDNLEISEYFLDNFDISTKTLNDCLGDILCYLESGTSDALKLLIKYGAEPRNRFQEQKVKQLQSKLIHLEL